MHAVIRQLHLNGFRSFAHASRSKTTSILMNKWSLQLGMQFLQLQYKPEKILLPMCGFRAQLVGTMGRATHLSNAEVMASNPVEARIFFWLILQIVAKIAFITAMITYSLIFISFPQFTYIYDFIHIFIITTSKWKASKDANKWIKFMFTWLECKLIIFYFHNLTYFSLMIYI